MSLYAVIAFAGNGVGAFGGGWIELQPQLRWRWIQWIHLMQVSYLLSISVPLKILIQFVLSVTAAYFLVFILVVKETRPPVIHPLAKAGDQMISEKAGRDIARERKSDLRRKLYVSCTRPICKPTRTFSLNWECSF